MIFHTNTIMAELTTEQKIEVIVKALDSKRAEDIQAIKIGDLTIIADYFIIADGTSNIHTKSRKIKVITTSILNGGK